MGRGAKILTSLFFNARPAQVDVEEGALICPETGRRFPIVKGIPNLLLNEDEC